MPSVSSLLAGLRRRIRGLGFDLARFPIHTTREGHLRWLLEAYQVSLVLDVGANEGQFANSLRSVVGFSGRIVSFEPTPSTAGRLRSRADSDRAWEVRSYGLGAKDEVLPLHLFDSHDWNSLHAPDLQALEAADRVLQPTGTTEVAVRRLDGIWESLVEPTDRVLLKSDTQGHELQVVAGLGDRARDLSGALLEVSLRPMYAGEPGLPEVLDVMSGHGLHPSGFFPVTRRRGGLALETVDVSFVRP